jgi:hypothetical protein
VEFSCLWLLLTRVRFYWANTQVIDGLVKFCWLWLMISRDRVGQGNWPTYLLVGGFLLSLFNWQYLKLGMTIEKIKYTYKTSSDSPFNFWHSAQGYKEYNFKNSKMSNEKIWIIVSSTTLLTIIAVWQEVWPEHFVLSLSPAEEYLKNS